MSILKYFDIFDVKFNFYTENQPINHSAFGGIMTISFLIISCVAVYIFERDEFFKLNPISSISEITYGYGNVKKRLSDEKIWIPFRMATYESKYIDHKNFLYPIINAIKGKRNEKNEMELEYTKLNYKLCNETSMANKTDNYIINVNLNELYCIEDGSDDLIGGSWDKEEVYYIEFNLFLCKNKIDYDESNSECTKFDDLFKYSSWVLEFYFPVVQYQPLNKKTPIDVVYNPYYYRLASYTGKVERINLKENVLSDDQNIIGNNRKNSSYWGISNSYGDSYFLPIIKDLLVKSTTSRLYSLVINKDPGLIYYKRSYKKILDILSDIFPVLNIIYIVFHKITEKAKMSYIKRDLIELLFEKKFAFNTTKNNIIKKTKTTLENMTKPRYFNSNLQQRNPIKLIPNSGNLVKNNNSILYKDEIIYERSSQNMNINNNLILPNSLNRLNLFSNYYLNEIENNNNKKTQNKAIEFKKSLNNNNFYKKKLFPIYFYFMDVIFDRLIQPKKFLCISEKYLIVYNFMNQLYDISTYILLYKQFQLFKISLYRKQSQIINEYFKMNIQNNELMKNLDNVLRFRKFPVFSDIIFDNS